MTEGELSQGDQEQYAGALKQKRLWEGLTSHEGWRILVRLMAEQVERRLVSMLTPLGTTDLNKDISQQEFTKGEASAFKMIMKIPQEQLEQAQEIINAYREIEDGRADDEPDDTDFS